MLRKIHLNIIGFCIDFRQIVHNLDEVRNVRFSKKKSCIRIDLSIALGTLALGSALIILLIFNIIK